MEREFSRHIAPLFLFGAPNLQRSNGERERHLFRLSRRHDNLFKRLELSGRLLSVSRVRDVYLNDFLSDAIAGVRHAE